MANVVEVILRGTDSLSSPVGKAGASLAAFINPATLAIGAVAALAAGMAAVGTVFFNVGKQFIESADNINILSQKTGVAADVLSRLGFVAEEENTSLETLSKGLKHAAGEALKAGQDFETFIISQADAFSKYEEGPRRAAEASRIFGREGLVWIPILNKGSEGLRDALKAAEEFTTVIDGDTARAADELNDELGRTWNLLKKGITDAIKPMIPELVALARAFTEFVKDQESFGVVWKLIAAAISDSILLIHAAMLSWVGLGRVISSVSAASQHALEGSFDAAKDALVDVVMDATLTWEKINSVFNNPVKLNVGKADNENAKPDFINEDDVQKALALLEQMELALKKGLEKQLEDNRLNYEKRLEVIDKFEIEAADKEELRRAAERERNQKDTEAHIEDVQKRHDLEVAIKRGAFDELQKINESQDGINNQWLESQRNLLSAYQNIWERSLLNVRAAFRNFAAQSLLQLSQGFGNAIGSIATGAQKAGEAFKALGKQMVGALASFLAQLLINTVIARGLQAALTKATLLTIAPIAAAWGAAATAASIATFGGAAASGSLAFPVIGAGAAFTAAFSSLGGAAHGGLDYVPSESTFLLQRGERVIQPQANEDLTDYLAGRGGQGSGQPIHIQIGDEVIYRGIYRATRDGRLVIDRRAVQ